MIRLLAVVLCLWSTGAMAMANKEFATPVAMKVAVKALPIRNKDVKVISGDWIRVKGRDVRIWGYEAPTLTIACEKVRAAAAITDLKTLLATGKLTYKTVYGVKDVKGRLVAQVFKNGTNVSTTMLAGNATNGTRTYTGGGKTLRSGC